MKHNQQPDYFIQQGINKTPALQTYAPSGNCCQEHQRRSTIPHISSRDEGAAVSLLSRWLSKWLLRCYSQVKLVALRGTYYNHSFTFVLGNVFQHAMSGIHRPASLPKGLGRGGLVVGDVLKLYQA
jgi:hypothetical protein